METINEQRHTPAVSVIIPVYNLEKYLDTCLESVETQTFTDFEAVVIDDGSTDRSLEVLRRHAARDPRIVVETKANAGVAKARETGLARARGRYICFLDGDDWWMPDMLLRMTTAIGERGGYDIVCCDYKRVCRTYESPVHEHQAADMEGMAFLEALLSNRIWGGLWGKLYRKELFETGIHHHALRLWQDVAVNIQIACTPPRVRFIDYVGYCYVQRAGSSNHSKLDFDYCRLFCDTVAREIMQRQSLLYGRAEYCVLLNNFRTYMMYLCKSHRTWVGNSPFARSLRKLVARYCPELKAHYSSGQLLMFGLDRWWIMRPFVTMLATILRWRKSLERRLSH